MIPRGEHWADRGEVVRTWDQGEQTFELWVADDPEEMGASIGWDGPEPGRLDLTLRDTIDGPVVEVSVHALGLPVRLNVEPDAISEPVAVPWREESLARR